MILTELLPKTVRQPALWSEIDSEKRERAWKVMDGLNQRLGRDTVRILSAGPKVASWKLRGGTSIAAVDDALGRTAKDFGPHEKRPDCSGLVEFFKS